MPWFAKQVDLGLSGGLPSMSTFDGFPPSSDGFEFNFRRFFTPSLIFG